MLQRAGDRGLPGAEVEATRAGGGATASLGGEAAGQKLQETAEGTSRPSSGHGASFGSLSKRRQGENLERKKRGRVRERCTERIRGTWSGRAGEVRPGGAGWLGGWIGKAGEALIGAAGKTRWILWLAVGQD